MIGALKLIGYSTWLFMFYIFGLLVMRSVNTSLYSITQTINQLSQLGNF